MLTVKQAEEKIEANRKRISELDAEIKRVSDPVKNSNGLYDKKVKAEKEARDKLALAAAEGKPATELLELQKAVDLAFSTVRQHEADINAFRAMWKKYGTERDSLKAEAKQLEKLIKFYPVFTFIEKTYSPAAKKFAEALKELDNISRQHECTEIFESLGTIVDFPISENGNLNVSTLFHGVKDA